MVQPVQQTKMQWVAQTSTTFGPRLKTPNAKSILGKTKNILFTDGIIYCKVYSIFTPPRELARTNMACPGHEKRGEPPTHPSGGDGIYGTVHRTWPPTAPPLPPYGGGHGGPHTHIYRYTHHMQRPRMGRQARGRAPPLGGGGSGLREDALVMCGAARRCMDSCGGHVLFFHSLGGTLE